MESDKERFAVTLLKMTNEKREEIKNLTSEIMELQNDFDVAVSAPIDASRLNELTRALSDKGYMGEEIALIMDGNVLRLLLDFCPIKMYSEGS